MYDPCVLLRYDDITYVTTRTRLYGCPVREPMGIMYAVLSVMCLCVCVYDTHAICRRGSSCDDRQPGKRVGVQDPGSRRAGVRGVRKSSAAVSSAARCLAPLFGFGFDVEWVFPVSFRAGFSHFRLRCKLLWRACCVCVCVCVVHMLRNSLAYPEGGGVQTPHWIFNFF